MNTNEEAPGVLGERTARGVGGRTGRIWGKPHSRTGGRRGSEAEGAR